MVIFDALLQSLPWESAPGLGGQRLYRLPALPCAAAAAVATTSSCAVGSTAVAPVLSEESDETTTTTTKLLSSSSSLHRRRIDISSTYYAINPSGDLSSTQDTFETWFQGLKGWTGRAGSAPPSAELASALQTKQLFVYCGHGGAAQYIPPARLRGLPRCAAALLMGCSSGRLQSGGGSNLNYYYEPTGVVLAYLLAGCPAAVANLWDVTDRDIDRFAQAVLMKWLKKEKKGGNDVAVSVAGARGVCKLPTLIGAAPVCYGVPTNVGW